MPKATYTRIIQHTTDAEFRQWASDLSTALKAVLTQTADTGQVDWTLGTQTKPAASTYSYYEVYRFNDALQSSRPVFLKVEYGSNSTATNPGIRFTLCSATNGAGVASGITFLSLQTISNQAPHAGIAPTTYVCAKDGYFGLAWGMMPTPAPATYPHAVFIIDRTRDTAGASTANGLFWAHTPNANGNISANHWSYDMGANWGAGAAAYSLCPAVSSQSSLSAKTKLYPVRVFVPDEYAVTALLNYLNIEITAYTELDAAPLPGVSPQRYLALGPNLGTFTVSQSANWTCLMRYET